jgi:hypothetical protein
VHSVRRVASHDGHLRRPKHEVPAVCVSMAGERGTTPRIQPNPATIIRYGAGSSESASSPVFVDFIDRRCRSDDMPHMTSRGRCKLPCRPVPHQPQRPDFRSVERRPKTPRQSHTTRRFDRQCSPHNLFVESKSWSAGARPARNSSSRFFMSSPPTTPVQGVRVPRPTFSNNAAKSKPLACRAPSEEINPHPQSPLANRGRQ